MSEEISLAEALSLAERFTNVYKAFAKIQQVLDKARQVEGQRDSLWAEVEARTKELQAEQAQAAAKLEAIQQEHREQLAIMRDQIKAAKESADQQIEAQAKRVEAELAELDAVMKDAEAHHKERSEFLTASIKQLEEREEIIQADVDVLEKKKSELVTFFEGIAKK